MIVTEAYGMLYTDKGGTFELNGDYFVRSFPVACGPSFLMCDLHAHLRGLRIVAIDDGTLGEEANVAIVADGQIIDGPFTSADDLNAFFGLDE